MVLQTELMVHENCPRSHILCIVFRLLALSVGRSVDGVRGVGVFSLECRWSDRHLHRLRQLGVGQEQKDTEK